MAGRRGSGFKLECGVTAGIAAPLQAPYFVPLVNTVLCTCLSCLFGVGLGLMENRRGFNPVDSVLDSEFECPQWGVRAAGHREDGTSHQLVPRSSPAVPSGKLAV